MRIGIKQLRLEQAWSQEKLAAMANLSIRTIQRIEKDGTCSLESKAALAAVFNLLPEQLMAKSETRSRNDRSRSSGLLYGYWGAGLGLICAYAGISHSVANGNMVLGESGIYFGAIGALFGLTCGLIGYLHNQNNRG